MAGLAGAAMWAAPALAGEGDVRLAVRVDGVPLASSSETNPIRLHPSRPAEVTVEIVNTTARPAEVRTIRVRGHVLGLTFFAYETAVRLSVAPGRTVIATYLLELGDLDGQATGLVVGSVALLDAGRSEIARQAMVVDVRGSLRSVYGAFGLGVATVTALSILGLLLAVARHGVHPNRWRRALRFLGPGIGLGLTVVFTLSALRVFVPRPGRWVPILAVCAGAAVLAGYLTPTPDEDGDLEDDDDLDGGEEGAPGRLGRPERS